jgi:hypothetical protein
MHDLNTEMGNFAITADRKAEEARARAAAIRGEPKAGEGFPEYDRSTEVKARAADAEAASWATRAVYARKGLMYLGPAPDDLKIQMDPKYSRLIAEAQSQCRCVYGPPAAEGTAI